MKKSQLMILHSRQLESRNRKSHSNNLVSRLILQTCTLFAYVAYPLEPEFITPEATMGRLEEVLPDELKKSAIACGGELVLPFPEASAAILVATDHEVAVLGVDAFEVRPDGLATVALFDASRNNAFTGDWKAYMALLNAECSRWLKEHRLGRNHGYILSSASESEFANLKVS